MDGPGDHANSSFIRFGFSDRFGDVIAGVSTRVGAVPGDPLGANMSYTIADQVGVDRATVTANRTDLVQSLGLDPTRLTMGRQVHDGRVHTVTGNDIGRGGLDPDTAIEATDGLVTDSPDAVLGVLQADCVPVAFHDPNRRVIAVVHSGWPGTVAKVTTNALAAMIDGFGCDPRDIRVAIGPSIGPDSYEVQDDVASQARAAFGPDSGVIVTRPDGSMAFDLWHANRLQALDAGVPPEQIEVTGLDSYRRDDLFFSHRRATHEGTAPCGRFLCLIALTG